MRSRVIPALAVVLHGCGGGGAGSGGEPVLRRDSAGVEIVESAAPAWTDGTGWTVGREPRVVIGSERDPLYQVAGSSVLGDGRIAVLDGGNRRVAFYDERGGFLEAVGGEGDGPGEFRFPIRMERRPDATLRIWDGGNRRLTDLSPDGDILGTATLGPTPDGRNTSLVGTLPSGTIIASAGAWPSMEGAADGELIHGEWEYWRYESIDAPGERIARFPDAERMVSVREFDGRTAVGIVSLQFRVPTLVELGEDGLVAVPRRGFEVWRFDASGAPTGSARWPGEATPLTPERFETWLGRLDADPRVIDRIRERSETVPLPPSIPPHDELMLDADGNAWLRDYRMSADAATSWTVIAGSGEWLGTVELPPRFSPHEIGDDYVIGVLRDALGVERVVVFDLVMR